MDLLLLFAEEQQLPSNPRIGAVMENQLETIARDYEGQQARELATNLLREDVIYIEFQSEVDFKLKNDSLEDGRGGKYFLLIR